MTEAKNLPEDIMDFLKITLISWQHYFYNCQVSIKS